MMMISAGATVGIIIASMVALFVLIYSVWYEINRRNGKIGERRVSSILRLAAKKYGGYVIDDVIIPSGKNNTAQIDNIYISPVGIFVVEVKDYSGRLYGNDSQKEWTQVLAYGHEKHKMYNPVMQNKTHVEALSRLLSYPGELISCIVILSADISRVETTANVFDQFEFKKFIKRVIRNSYREYDVEKYYQILKKHKDNPVKTSEEHVEEIAYRRDLINSYCCPYCGVPLVLRHSSTGRSFYGCPNYPKCKFTKKQ